MTGLFLALSIALTAPTLSRPDEAQQYGWHNDYAKALAEAKQRGRLLMVVFR
jgi:hypothetical protein